MIGSNDGNSTKQQSMGLAASVLIVAQLLTASPLVAQEPDGAPNPGEGVTLTLGGEKVTGKRTGGGKEGVGFLHSDKGVWIPGGNAEFGVPQAGYEKFRDQPGLAQGAEIAIATSLAKGVLGGGGGAGGGGSVGGGACCRRRGSILEKFYFGSY